jgi:hypothetical protein
MTLGTKSKLVMLFASVGHVYGLERMGRFKHLILKHGPGVEDIRSSQY